MIYIVGLGNPKKPEYIKTKHNVGSTVVENLNQSFSFNDFVFQKKSNSLVSSGKISNIDVTFVLPQTFMNLSGVALSKICKNSKDTDSIVILYDDLDIPIGEIKLSYNKSAGGHNGVSSVIEHLGSNLFLRIRVGIGQIDENGKSIRSGVESEQSDYVLESFKPEDKKKIEKTIPIIQSIIEFYIENGLDKTISKFGKISVNN